MRVAINDASFMKRFANIESAYNAMMEFCDVCIFLKKEEVSEVDARYDIYSSQMINYSSMLTEKESLIQILNEIKIVDRERFRFLLSIFQKNISEVRADMLYLDDIESAHCAYNKDNMFISLKSSESFAKKEIWASDNSGKKTMLKNLSEVKHIWHYWKELGFREYELNPKHGNVEYIRAGGKCVGIAPSSDKKGQEMLNSVVRVRDRLFSIDEDMNNQIFEFRHSYANKFHAYAQNDIDVKLRQEIIRVWLERKAQRE